jgi:SAM-dependent methyltransferase
MAERLYMTHPDVYDALYREIKEYDTEAQFIIDQFQTKNQTDSTRAVILGCGTGEHAKRLVAEGFTVLGIDKHEAMVERARQKSDATFQVGTLPDVDVDKSFDLVLVPFTVINHLGSDDLSPTLQTLNDLLTEGGVLILDNGRFPTPDNGSSAPGLRVWPTEAGDIARLTQLQPRDETRLRWNSIVFVQTHGEFFIDTHDLTVFDDDEIESRLHDLGFEVDTYEGYGTGEPQTVFVAC